jgi:hypothetical protein
MYNHVIAADKQTAIRVSELIDAGKVPALYPDMEDAVEALAKYPQPARYRIFSVPVAGPFASLAKVAAEHAVEYAPFRPVMPPDVPTYAHDDEAANDTVDRLPDFLQRNVNRDNARRKRRKQRALVVQFVTTTARQNVPAILCILLVIAAAVVYNVYHPY